MVPPRVPYLALLLLGCSASPASPDAPARDASAPASAAEAVASTADEAALQKGKPTPPPEQWPSAWKDKLTRAARLCAPVYAERYYDDEGPRIGCKECIVDKASSAPPEPIDWVPNSIDGIFPGNFTAPGAEEEIVLLGGCKPQLSPVGLLFRRVDGVWVRQADKSDLPVATGLCRKLRGPDARDLLVCVGSDTSGSSREAFVQLLDVNAKGQADVLGCSGPQRALVEICQYPEQQALVDWTMLDVRLEDANGDGQTDIVLHTEFSFYDAQMLEALRGKADFKQLCRCHIWQVEEDTKLDGCPEVDLTPPPGVATTLTFLAQSGGYEADAATRTVLKRVAPSCESGSLRLAPTRWSSTAAGHSP